MAVAITRESKYGPAMAGSLAYDLSYGGGAVRTRVPQEETRRPEPAVRPREREDARRRAGLRVRERQSVAPVSICGFLLVGICLMVVLLSHVRLIELSDGIVSLRSELKKLEAEEAALTAKYESMYDLSAVEAAMTGSGAMAKPRSDQIIYLDLAEPDNAVVYGYGADTEEYVETFQNLRGAFSDALEYLR